MNHGCLGYMFLAFTVSLSGCSSSVDVGDGGTGGTAGTGGSAGSGGTAGNGGSAGSGGAGGTRPCSSSGTVAFTFDGPGADSDCIVPGVCLTRNRVKGIYNAVTEVGPGDASPENTQWALSTCSAATEPDFTTFVELIRNLGSGAGSGGQVDENLVDAELCLWLTNEDLRYDVVFSEWGSIQNSNFGYSRTAFEADECGVAGATCGATCGCPEGFVEAEDGRCVVPDPCEPNPCGTDAECRRTGAATHRCECDTVEFTRPPGQPDVCDPVNDEVCLARNPIPQIQGGALYNSLEETAAASSTVCGDPIESRPSFPTFTEWTLEPCESAVDVDFVKFLDDAYACGGRAPSPPPGRLPNTIVGFESCLRTTNQGNDGELWSIQFTDWCSSGRTSPDVGCFSLVRWREVADDEACPGTP